MTDLDALERETLGVSMEAISARAGAIYLFDDKQGKLVFKYVLNFDDHQVSDSLIGKTLEPGQGVAGDVFARGVPSIDDDPIQHARFLREVGEGAGYLTKNMITLPLISMRGEKIGVMQALNKSSGNFDQEDLELLTIMAAHASNALVNARLHKEARAATIMHYLGDISHDIKNLMTPGQTGAQTLELLFESAFRQFDRLQSENESPVEALSQVQKAFEELRSFVPEMIQLIAYSFDAAQERVKEIAEAVKGVIAEPFFEDCNVNEVILTVLEVLRVVAERQGVSLVHEFGDLPEIPVDRKRLYSAIYNLVNNAIPETPAGGAIIVRTEARMNVLPSNEDRVCITVADTGGGMSEEVRDRLFTDHAISTKPGGTGLGTRIVKNVVDSHKGTIRVESEPGRGTTFYIELPCRQN